MAGRLLRVGAAQFASTVGALDANVDRHLHWIGRGRAVGLDLMVMPELSLTGHHGTEDLLNAAIRRTDPRLKRLAEAAGPMAVVIGFIEEGPAAQFYNAAAILHHGRLAYLHRKVNLPTYGLLEEGKHFASGRFVDTHALDADWRAGLLICADLWNPALTHLAFLHGATLLLAPVSSALEAVGARFDNPGGWALTMRFYAMMYGAPAIMVNRTGTEGELSFWGGSRILDPFGQTLAEAGPDEALITADLDYDALRRARQQLPTVRDSNIALVHRETERLIGKLGVPEFIRDDG
ncbi:MAG: nitrilase-related carbon-nitrogen hydrolase [Alphaproteobacteria bacterium]